MNIILEKNMKGFVQEEKKMPSCWLSVNRVEHMKHHKEMTRLGSSSLYVDIN